MENQLGLSELIKSTLGSEEQLLVGDETIFHFAMRIDELEEILDSDDIRALDWIIDHIKEEDRGGYLKEIHEAYDDAMWFYNENKIEDIDRHFREGMQYTYCYVKNLPINEETKKKAIAFFMSLKAKYKLGRLIVAYAIGRYIETMLEERTDTGKRTESDG